jgi:hypothetical protein
MLFEAAVVVVLAFSLILKPEIVTQSEPIILKIASVRIPAVRVEFAVRVTIPEVVIVTLLVVDVAPVKLIE